MTKKIRFILQRRFIIRAISFTLDMPTRRWLVTQWHVINVCAAMMYGI